jgi:hypothetical protein
MEVVLKYAVIFTLVPILIPILFSLKSKSTTKALVILLSLIVASSMIPLYPLDGNGNNLHSIWDFVLGRNNTSFIVMLSSYFLSLVLLAIPGHKLDKVSLGTYIIGYISSWVGFFTGDFGMIVYNAGEYGQTAYITSFVWFLLYLLIPMINFLFYIPLVSSEKSKKKAIYEMQQRAEQARKRTLGDELIPLLLVGIPLVLYIIVGVYIYDKYQCSGNQDCIVWGSYLSKAGGFGIAGFFTFITILAAISKKDSPTQRKIARIALPFVLLFFVFANYAVFQTYIKTSSQGIESKDFINGLMRDIKPVKLSWEEIQNFGIDTYKSDGKCKVNNTYLILKDGSKVKLSTSVNNDQSFLNYLANEKGIKLNTPPQCK